MNGAGAYDDAYHYLESVKQKYNTEPRKYEEFLQIMKSFKQKQMATDQVLERVSQLFDGDEALLQGFHTFLPMATTPSVAPQPGRVPTVMVQPITSATGYHGPVGFHSTSIGPPPLNASQTRPVSSAAPPISAAAGGIAAQMIPKFDVSQSHPRSADMATMNSVSGGTHSSSAAASQSSRRQSGSAPAAAPMRMSQPILPPPVNHPAHPLRHGPIHGHRADLVPAMAGYPQASLLGLPPRPDDEAAMPRGGGNAGYEFARDYVTRIRQRYNSGAKNYHQFLSILQTYAHARKEKSPAKTEKALMGLTNFLSDSPDLLKEFLRFVPHAVSPDASIPPFKRPRFNGGVGGTLASAAGIRGDFPLGFQGVQPPPPPGSGLIRRPGAPPLIPDLPVTMPLIDPGQMNSVSLATSTLASQPNPVDRIGVNSVGASGITSSGEVGQSSLPRVGDQSATATEESGATDNTDDSQSDRRSHKARTALGPAIITDLKDKVPPAMYSKILRIMQLYPLGLADFPRVCSLVSECLEDAKLTDVAAELRSRVSNTTQRLFNGPSQSMCKSYYNYLTKNSELMKLPKVQQSYRKLPSDIIQPRCSGRTQLCRSVLNDSYISKPTGHEGPDTSQSGVVFRNQFKETLLQNEEDMFELDLMIETNKATALKLQRMQQNPEQLNMMNLTAVDKRVIGRLYGESADSILKAVHDQPEKSLSVVIRRLQQKTGEWLELRRQMRPVWFMHAQCLYFQAHDYRYTVFKKAEEFRLRTKTLSQEIEERHRKRKEDPEFGFDHQMVKDEHDVLKEEEEDMMGDVEMTDSSATMIKEEEHDADDEHDEDVEMRGDSVAEVAGASSSSSSASASASSASSSFSKVGGESSSAMPLYNPLRRTRSAVLPAPVLTSGVVDGVGVTHSRGILSEMTASLVAEKGVISRTGLDCIDSHDMRFYMDNADTLRDTANLLLSYAKRDIHQSGRGTFSGSFRVMFEMLFGIEGSDLMDSFHRLTESEERVVKEEEDSNNSQQQQQQQQKQSDPVKKEEEEKMETGEPLAMLMDDVQKAYPEDCALFERQLAQIRKGERLESVRACNAECPLKWAESEDRGSTVIWANNHMYFAVRYFQKCYARLEYARHIGQNDDSLRRMQSAEDKRRKYEAFLTLVQRHLTERQRDEVLEDSLRRLLGLQAYQLFSLLSICKQWYSSFTNVWDCVNYSTDFLILARLMQQKMEQASSDKERSLLFEAHWQMAFELSQQRSFQLYCCEFFPKRGVLALSLADSPVLPAGDPAAAVADSSGGGPTSQSTSSST